MFAGALYRAIDMSENMRRQTHSRAHLRILNNGPKSVLSLQLLYCCDCFSPFEYYGKYMATNYFLNGRHLSNSIGFRIEFSTVFYKSVLTYYYQ